LTILKKYPEAAKITNQFGRIPLHYALDRCKVDYKIIESLITIFPMGVSLADIDGITPYQLCLKWKHSNSIFRLFLNADPSLDPKKYSTLNYGLIIGYFINFLRTKHFSFSDNRINHTLSQESFLSEDETPEISDDFHVIFKPDNCVDSENLVKA
jgi:ankyrin repeat protein